ncbi:glutamate ABC transporter substrate-binding protein [Actinophytocola gossypii]|uniref:Glutamate ABC transporter substrate-binding protein n=1 Tax=Actinophytocola gossypii TaxID=2812003 RepID=A0ABT2J858_9PSEU|nr:glutamate ABC transporter substrate-binding protein [Actinophytocola gossypii]MCT2584045.1 glutamate ABC transporter substrate-binding protein [Actinophytocola gossypii]
MRFSRVLRAGALVAATSLALAACGGGGDDEGGNGGGGGEGGSGDSLTIGIKFDQPGLGQQTPDGYEGFDVDVATYIAKEMGVSEDSIEWKETPSAERENMIDNGDVDFIVATYSITDERKERVSFAGPYYIAHQDLLVRQDDSAITGPDSLNGKKLCSVSGSTSAQRVKDEYAQQVDLLEYGGYSECLTALENGQVDAITTDDVILAGLAAANPGKFKVVGEGFSDENYGVGIPKGDAELQTQINDAITKMFEDGAWKAAIDKHLGPAGFEAPEPPEITETSAS